MPQQTYPNRQCTIHIKPTGPIHPPFHGLLLNRTMSRNNQEQNGLGSSPYLDPRELGILLAYQQCPNPPSSTSSSSLQTTPDGPRRYCTWCGMTGHVKNKCADLTAAFQAGVVHTRRGKICLGPIGGSGESIPYPHGERCLREWVAKRTGTLPSDRSS